MAFETGRSPHRELRRDVRAANVKPPLKPLFITVSEAVRLSGVSRGRLWEWMDAGLLPFRYNGARRLIKFTDLEATLDSLPRGSAPAAGPLLPEQDQALARERANPDFARIFTERFENLVPRLGEDEARRQALAHGVRAYRSYHDCAYKPARAALLALIKLNPPSAQLQTDSTNSLLPLEDPERAIELASEFPVDQQQPAEELASGAAIDGERPSGLRDKPKGFAI